MISHSMQYGHGLQLARAKCLGGVLVIASAALLASVAHPAIAQELTPTAAYSNAFHAAVLNGTGVPDNAQNGLSIITNGIIDPGGGTGPVTDRFDTWNSDATGVSSDFVGLSYDSVNRFDRITIEMGNQFGDGGDWEEMPRVFILKNPTLVGSTVAPELSPAWVEVTGATETSGHVFNPIVVPGPGDTVELDLSSIPAMDRTGWGWAVGGVSGNQNAEGIYNFITVTEAYAEGAPVAPIQKLVPSTMQPVNVVANSYNSVARQEEDLVGGWRGDAFASVTNGLVLHDAANDGFDTWEGDTGGVLTDFVGLQYNAIYTFDTLTVELANQFADGGDWEATPRIFILKNPVDTNTTRPEDDPSNWMEVTGAVETTGHVFDPLVTPGPGGTINFDLSSIPANQRTGWGWAVGGVDGNANEAGIVNFVSITEVDATGSLVPGPYELGLTVNTATGEVRIVNEASFDIDLDFYRVTSAAGSLNTTGWNSLEDPSGNPSGFPSGDGSGNGWEELGNLDDTIVAEGFLEGSSVLGSGGNVSLGQLFDGGAQDLLFRYRTASGAFIDGVVEYITGGDVTGDYNGNGIVDAADYTIWRDSLGQTGTGLAADGNGDNVVNQQDYAVWKNNFGSTGGAAAGSAVPEPASVVLLVLALGGFAAIGFRRGGRTS